MDELFKSIRESCSTLVWSRGVELSREGGVVGEHLSDNEVVLSVASPGRAVAATVKLWLEDEDWLCDCHSSLTPCEHVAAGIIALRRSKAQGKPLPISNVSRGIVVYYFTRKAGSLSLERMIKSGDKETPLESSLSALLSGRVAGPAVNANKEDLRADGVLNHLKSGLLPSVTVGPLLVALHGSTHVFLDGKKVSVGRPTSGILVIIEEALNGVRAISSADPEITESFLNGAVRMGKELRPVQTPEFTVIEREIIRNGRSFTPEGLAELASNVIPGLREKLPVEVRTEKLPKVSGDARPRLTLQTTSLGETLSVLPLIVYGDPPIARVDRGKLVLLGDAKVVPERSPGLEARLAASLHSEFGFSVGKRVDFRGDAAVKFAEQLGRWRGSVTGNGLTYFGRKTPIAAEVGFEGQQFKVSFGLPGGASVDTGRVFKAWQEGLGRVPLDGGEGWAPLPVEWLEKYGHRVLDLLNAKDTTGKFPTYVGPEIARLFDELNTPCPPQFKKLREQLEGFAGIPRASLPKDLMATLRPYQQVGVDWLKFLQKSGMGALLADDMGLGKTLQTMAVFSGRVLVVAPTSVLPNWEREIHRFRPKLSVSVYHGGERQLERKAEVTLTTYAILRLDIESLAKIEWDMVVLDEAQNIKNPESQVAQAAYRLNADFRAVLTGTPIENRLEDLWSLFHFLNPGLLSGRSDFQSRYGTVGLPTERLKELRTKIKPFILRRLKHEVARELPPRTDLVLYCDLEPTERNAYETVRAAAQKEVLERLSHQGNVLQALECLLRLRQAACHPGLLPGQSADDSSKVKLLREKLEEVVAEDHKALVFSQWTSLLDLIEPHLKASGLGFCRIDGSTRNRAAVVEAFQSEGGPPVMLMTLKAGGVGLNLTAADYVFLVDPWWNPAAEDQAADRAHRIGQDRPVFVHRLVARGTVEEKILVLQESKRAAAEAALGGSDRAGGITRDELMALLR